MKKTITFWNLASAALLLASIQQVQGQTFSIDTTATDAPKGANLVLPIALQGVTAPVAAANFTLRVSSADAAKINIPGIAVTSPLTGSGYSLAVNTSLVRTGVTTGTIQGSVTEFRVLIYPNTAATGTFNANTKTTVANVTIPVKSDAANGALTFELVSAIDTTVGLLGVANDAGASVVPAGQTRPLGGSKSFNVINAGSPATIVLTPSTLTPSVVAGNDATAGSFTVGNSGTELLTYTISESISWLSVDSVGGTSTGENDTINVTYDTDGLNVGNYSGTITVAAAGATNSPQNVTVNLAVTQVPGDDSYEPNNTITRALTANPLPLNTVVPLISAGNEDWYKVVIPNCDNALIRVQFNNALGNLNADIYDYSCELGNTEFRLAEAYSASSSDEIMKLVNYGADELYLRVYGEGGATNPNYTVTITPQGQDDAYEPNDFAGQVTPLQLGTAYNNLVLRDDDFFRIDTSASEYLKVTVDSDFNLGQLYYMVLEDNGTYNVINGGASSYFIPNQLSMPLDGIFVGDRDSVVVRVYGANRGQNFYNLLVENGALTKPGAVDPSIGEGAAWEPAPVAAKVPFTPPTRFAEDVYEPNNTYADVANATPIDIDEVVGGLALNNTDWYRIQLPNCQNAKITVAFSHAQGNIQTQLWDDRCDTSSGRFRLAESYGSVDGEVMTFVNRGVQDLYLEVYRDGAGLTDQPYTIRVETVGTDDAYEPNGVNFPATLALDSTIDAVAKNDDFYRVAIPSGTTQISVSVNHDFNSGQLYFAVLEDNGTFNVINGGSASFYVPNVRNMVVNPIDVTGRTSVNVRVFGATRGQNFYTLSVNDVSP